MGDRLKSSTGFEPTKCAPSEAPVSIDVSDDHVVQCESVPESAARTADGDATWPLWRITIREFGTERILARWSVRRVFITTPMTQDWADSVGQSMPSSATRTPLGASEHPVMVARGHGDLWHSRPSEHPLGSSEWLACQADHPEHGPPARQSEHPLTEGCTRTESPGSSHRVEHLGASERWLGSAHFHAAEDRWAAERPGLSWGAINGNLAAKRCDDP